MKRAGGFDLTYDLFHVVVVLQEDMLGTEEAKEVFSKCLYTMNEVLKLYPTQAFREMMKKLGKMCDTILREAQAKLAEETDKFCVSEAEFVGKGNEEMKGGEEE